MPSNIRICIIGAGPRGTVALERICANAPLLAATSGVDVDVVDPYPPGAGRVWQQDQPRRLLMNTVAGDVTVFTDPTVTCEGPLTPGPTQYQWARMVAEGAVADVSDDAKAEAAQMNPWSYATRAFQGEYLNWAFHHIIGRAPSGVSVRVHQTRARTLRQSPDCGYQIRLEDTARCLRADAVVLAQGHYDVGPTQRERELATFARRHGLVYIPPASPAEADLDGIQPGEPVILRGLGLNFYDYMILLTEGRGGQFIRNQGSLRYLPSGDEPRLYAGSGRGIPYRARAEIRKEVVPRYQPSFLTADVIARLRRAGETGANDFVRDLLPLITKEAAWVYYRTVLQDAPVELRDMFREEFPRHQWGSHGMQRLIEKLVPEPEMRWDWQVIDRPADGSVFTCREDLRSWIIDQLSEDLRHSRLGPDRSAVKAAAAMMRDLRDEIRQVISHRGISGTSYREHIDGWFSGLINYAASGPPALRVEQLMALIEAGVAEPMGPRLRVTADERAKLFTAHSQQVKGTEIRVRALVEAYLPPTDVRRATDPLIEQLRTTGQCRPYSIPDADGNAFETGGLDVTKETFRVVRADGRPHDAVFCYGPPIEGVQWVTAIGARPHVNSRTLLQGDSIARSCLRAGMALNPERKDHDQARDDTGAREGVSAQHRDPRSV